MGKARSLPNSGSLEHPILQTNFGINLLILLWIDHFIATEKNVFSYGTV
jgi:hypothetical protein